MQGKSFHRFLPEVPPRLQSLGGCQHQMSHCRQQNSPAPAHQRLLCLSLLWSDQPNPNLIPLPPQVAHLICSPSQVDTGLFTSCSERNQLEQTMTQAQRGINATLILSIFEAKEHKLYASSFCGCERDSELAGIGWLLRSTHRLRHGKSTLTLQRGRLQVLHLRLPSSILRLHYLVRGWRSANLGRHLLLLMRPNF